MIPFLGRRLATMALATWLAIAPPSFRNLAESAAAAPAGSAPCATAHAPPPPPPAVHVVNVSCCAFSDAFNGSNHTFVTPGTIVESHKLDASAY